MANLVRTTVVAAIAAALIGSSYAQILPAPAGSGQFEQLARLPATGNVPQAHWWSQSMLTPVEGNALPISLEQVVFAALQNSNRIKIARIDGFVEQEKITQQDANFDWTAFADSLFRNTNQPTGSAIEAGDGVDRLVQQELTKKLGLKRKNRIGGQFDVAQDLKLLQNNSELTNPNDQAFSQLVLRYNQPLLQNGGALVNHGQVILAQLNANATIADSDASIATILEEVSQAYWEVYRLRARYLVQKRLVDRIRELRENLRQRSRIDAKESLLGQAESEFATQQATLAATRTQLKQAELKLIRAAGDRSLSRFQELIPTSQIPPFHLEVDPSTAFPVALQNRPEVRAAFQRIQSSDLTKKIAYRQLLPQLALVLETTVTGVQGNFDLGRSFGDQFSAGGPGYAVGLNYEIPLGNRAAKSRARQAEWQLSREVANLEDTIDQIRLEVEESVVGLTGAANQYRIREESIQKSQLVVDALLKRRNLFPESIDQVSQLYIREVLDAQQRTTAAELALIDLLFDYAVTTIKVRRATGTLLSRYSTAAPSQLPYHHATSIAPPVTTPSTEIPTQNSIHSTQGNVLAPATWPVANAVHSPVIAPQPGVNDTNRLNWNAASTRDSQFEVVRPMNADTIAPAALFTTDETRQPVSLGLSRLSSNE